MSDRVVRSSRRTALAGDPFASGFGLLELVKSKKGTALASAYGAILPLILSDKLPALPGAIILGAVASVFMLSQALVDIFLERNRAHATEVITTELEAPAAPVAPVVAILPVPAAEPPPPAAP